MSKETHLYSFLLSAEDSSSELDLLMGLAEGSENNPELYDLYCRSLSILVVSHLEAFMKGFLKSVIEDLNENLKFQDLPESLKRTCVKSFLPRDKEYKDETRKIKEQFEASDVDLTSEPFFNLAVPNKNPSDSQITTIFYNLGIDKVFNYLKDSKLEEVFEDNLSKSQSIYEEVKAKVTAGSEDFPYSFSGCEFELNLVKVKGGPKSLFEEFLSSINSARHKVVHGNTFENLTSHKDLRTARLKIDLMKMGLIAVFLEKMRGSVNSRNL